MPYDQLVHWQLAGDERLLDDPLAMAATGSGGGGVSDAVDRGRIRICPGITSSTTWSGQPVSPFLASRSAVRCHDHKYDPIPSEDYYRLAATFTATIRSEIEVSPGPGAHAVKMQVTAEGYPHTKHHADDRGFPHLYVRRRSP